MDKKDADQKQQTDPKSSTEANPAEKPAGTPDKSAPPEANPGQSQSKRPASSSGQPGAGKSRRNRGGRGQQKQTANQQQASASSTPGKAPSGDHAAGRGEPVAQKSGAGSPPPKPPQNKAAGASQPAADKPIDAAAKQPQTEKTQQAKAAKDDQKTSTAGSDTSTKTARTDSGEPKASSAAVGVLSIWLVLVFLLLAGSLGGASWYGLQLLDENHDRISELESDFSKQHQNLNQQAERIADANEALQERDARIENEIGELKQSLDAQRAEIDSALDARTGEVESRIDHLATNVQRIEDRLSRGEVAWKTAEIGFLLTRAQERLVIARDPAGAAVALDLADRRIAQLARPHWLGLRDQIATALGEIESARSFDRIGAALSMRRLGDQVSEWPLAEESVIDTAATDTDELTEPSRPPIDASLPWYERTAKQTWRWITDQFHVEQKGRVIEPVSRFETDREMRIWLTAVREALLARDVPSLERALHEAEYWLTEHYNLEDAGPARLAEKLAEIRNSAGLSEYPDLQELFTAWEAADMRERENARRYNGEGEQ